ncbi:hypothetical protein DPMN_143125 [Dreissena polymorpha]|uniref:Uncharacterized protein n=1 Tax=Dreissena polymorpha TaxID=45954 RepID=A0A9D4GGM2_DREPO|nr:hypothetical protein DPMN_143125 [Dreissena polymorpha]
MDRAGDCNKSGGEKNHSKVCDYGYGAGRVPVCSSSKWRSASECPYRTADFFFDFACIAFFFFKALEFALLIQDSSTYINQEGISYLI